MYSAVNVRSLLHTQCSTMAGQKQNAQFNNNFKS